MPAFKRHLVKRFEFYLVTLVGVFLTAEISIVIADQSAVLIFGVTAIGMIVIQGAIQWADRQRQQALRARAIHEIREMLRDQVLNQLAAMKMWMAEDPDPETIDVLLHEVDESIDGIAGMIDRLSEEQLDTWKLTYANAADLVVEPHEGLALA